MKNLMLCICLFLSFISYSQTKVGTIDVDLIISKMPEIEQVQKELEAYGKQLDTDFKTKYEAYTAMIAAYKQEESGLTIKQRQDKENEILTVEAELEEFQQKGTQLVNLKRDELMRPLFEKIRPALDKVADREGYTQILQLNANIVYIVEEFDITNKVMIEMGISPE